MWKRLAILLSLAGSLMNTGVLAALATYYPTHGYVVLDSYSSGPIRNGHLVGKKTL